MSIPLYIDENMHGPWIAALRSRGVDLITVNKDGMSSRADPEVLNRAIIFNRVLVTFDQDYFKIGAELLRNGLEFPGIIFIKQFGASGQDLYELEFLALAGLPEDFRNRFWRIPLQ